jgi:hypothetical protein
VILQETLRYHNTTLQAIHWATLTPEIQKLLARNEMLNSENLTVQILKPIMDEIRKDRALRGFNNSPYSLQFYSCFYANKSAATAVQNNLMTDIQNSTKSDVCNGFLL